MTPYEVWKGYKPNVSHFRIFGCGANVHIPKGEKSKMIPKAKKIIFLGYGIGVKGYRLYDTSKAKNIHARDIIFDELASTTGEQSGKEVVNQPQCNIKTVMMILMKSHKKQQDYEDHPEIRKLQNDIVNGSPLLII